MSDEDRAQVLELREWELRNRSRPAPVKYAPTDTGYGPSECTECNMQMPPERRAHGFILCVPCRTHAEKKERIYRR
jgi:hypothetical protein